MSTDLKKNILEAQKAEEPQKAKVKTTMESNFCNCLKTSSEDEYWGCWLECECGYKSNVVYAKYCGGCGKEIRVVGIAKNSIEHYGQR